MAWFPQFHNQIKLMWAHWDITVIIIIVIIDSNDSVLSIVGY